MFRKDYTDQEIIDAAKDSLSCAQLLKKIGLRPVGGNYATMKKKLFKLNVDCSHWTGHGWNKNKKLKNWENYTRAFSAKKHLIKELGHKCEQCLISVWYDKPIPLEVHHIDGDRTNNMLENLQLLCPNCHSFTDNFRGKNNKSSIVTNSREKIVNLPTKEVYSKKQRIIKPMKEKSPRVRKTKINWPNKESLDHMLQSESVRSIAKKFGVSDNAVRKRAQKYGIDISKISMWSQKYGDCSSKWRKG